jgi:6-phosphogluconolactonase
MKPMTPERPAGVRERRFDSSTVLVATLAAEIVQTLRAAIAARGSATLVVSGGTTPVPLFRALRQCDLAWDRVTVTLADERWVDVADSQSNEGLVRRELLLGRASDARFVGLKTPAPSAQLGAAEAWQAVQALPRPFDVVVLGMGNDGHTASLFPGSPGIDAALDPAAPPACVAMSAPTAPNARLSLNLAALMQARLGILHITGAAKWDLYRAAAAAAARPGALDGPPIAAVLRSGMPRLQVCWAP